MISFNICMCCKLQGFSFPKGERIEMMLHLKNQSDYIITSENSRCLWSLYRIEKNIPNKIHTGSCLKELEHIIK